MKTLFEIDVHPYVSIKTKGKKLVVSFNSQYSSTGMWYELTVKYDAKEKQYTLLSKKP